MPTYDYECPRCSVRWEHFSSYEERDSGPACPDCGAAMGRLPSAPQLNTAACRMESYYDETLGRTIHTERQRKYEMARKGLADYEPDSEDRSLTREIRYAEKYTKNKKEVRAFAARASRDLADKRRERVIEERVDKALKKM